jgi:hypothetical protein
VREFDSVTYIGKLIFYLVLITGVFAWDFPLLQHVSEVFKVSLLCDI